MKVNANAEEHVEQLITGQCVPVIYHCNVDFVTDFMHQYPYNNCSLDLIDHYLIRTNKCEKIKWPHTCLYLQ